MMQAGSVCHSILDVKKLKKDGSISGNCVDEIIRILTAIVKSSSDNSKLRIKN